MQQGPVLSFKGEISPTFCGHYSFSRFNCYRSLKYELALFTSWGRYTLQHKQNACVKKGQKKQKQHHSPQRSLPLAALSSAPEVSPSGGTFLCYVVQSFARVSSQASCRGNFVSSFVTMTTRTSTNSAASVAKATKTIEKGDCA